MAFRRQSQVCCSNPNHFCGFLCAMFFYCAKMKMMKTHNMLHYMFLVIGIGIFYTFMSLAHLINDVQYHLLTQSPYMFTCADSLSCLVKFSCFLKLMSFYQFHNFTLPSAPHVLLPITFCLSPSVLGYTPVNQALKTFPRF